MVEVGIVTAISFFSSLHLEKQEMKQAAFQPGLYHYCTFSPSQTQSPPPRNKSALKYDREHKVCIKVEGGVGLSCYNCKINVDSVELLLVVTTKAKRRDDNEEENIDDDGEDDEDDDAHHQDCGWWREVARSRQVVGAPPSAGQALRITRVMVMVVLVMLVMMVMLVMPVMLVMIMVMAVMEVMVVLAMMRV